jgi:hypothetical protein
MNAINCLNCSEITIGKYCHNCGQKAATHRITTKHFIAHDLIHGVYHIDKGIPFTLKETFTRPGYAALDYIAGKRIKYYNIFYLILLVVGFLILAGDIKGSGKIITNKNPDIVLVMTVFDGAVRYFKFILFALVPVLALNSHILFRKLKLNYAENLIVAGFGLLGSYVILMISFLVGKINSDIENIIGPFTLLFPILVYYQATRGKYKLKNFIGRMIAFYFLLLFEVLALFIIAVKIYKAIVSS